MQLSVLSRLQLYCRYFDDYQALNELKISFLKNKESLEKVTCHLAGIEHDGSKTWGEDGYLHGEKVEIKNICYTGKTKLSGRVKFHDLNTNRISEFETEPYWLVLGCYNYQSVNPMLCEIIFGFKMDEKVSTTLRDKIQAGRHDPEISMSVYKHLLEDENKLRVFYQPGNLSKSAFTRQLYTTLNYGISQRSIN